MSRKDELDCSLLWAVYPRTDVTFVKLILVISLKKKKKDIFPTRLTSKGSYFLMSRAVVLKWYATRPLHGCCNPGSDSSQVKVPCVQAAACALSF